MIENLSTILTKAFEGNFFATPVFVLLLVWICIQWTKILIDLLKTRRIYWSSILIAWGFPSSHSGLASCVTTLSLLEYWYSSIVFAITLAFSILFAYDAMNVRFQTWEQARYINSLKQELSWVLDTKKQKIKLKERMGHTPSEVAWWVAFWFILTVIFYYVFLIN